MSDVLQLLERLRDPHSGCRWDLQQDWQSILAHSREEIQELAEAIEENDSQKVCEELGDLLFHIAFYSQIAQERNLFSFADVAERLCKKMIERHAHVFPDGKLDGRRVAVHAQPSIKELNAQWDAIKEKQKNRSE